MFNNVTIDDAGFRTITINDELDVTVAPGKTATVWKGMQPINSIPCVVITYNYEPGDKHHHKAIREGKSAVEFIVTSWIHGRMILNVEEHACTNRHA